MKRLMIAAALCVSALSACALSGCGILQPPASATAGALGDHVVLKSTIALSLGELAFTGAEQTATAALRSPHLSKDDAARLGTLVHDARGYRDQARKAVAAGQDASTILGNLNGALSKITPLTAKGS